MATLAQCQRAYDNQSPPEPDEQECPECGDAIEEHEDGWRCINVEDCGWSVYPDYEEQPILGEG